MARTKPQEIIRRVGVPSQQSAKPDLVVAADLDSSRGHSALSSIAADTLSRVSTAFARKATDDMVEKAKEDEVAGATARSQEDLNGAPRREEATLSEMSAAWRRGYLKTDGALRLRDWQIEAARELTKAEPGSDIEPVLRAKLAELMEAPEFQDPQVKAALMPAVTRAADEVRATWVKEEMKETVLRQEESLTALAVAAFKDKSLLTADGMVKFYENLNNEEFAYLNHRDVDAIVARGAIDALQSGEVDPDEVIEFLGQSRKDGTPGLLHNKEWTDQLQNAARAGKNVIAARFEEAQAQAMADSELRLQDLAERGQMTDKVILAEADRFGLEGKERIQFIRHWGTQQEQTLRRWEQERKEAARHAETLRALNGNPYEVGMAKAKKAAGQEYGAATAEQRPALIKKYARMGVPIPQLQAVFDSMTSASLPEASRLYMALRKIDPEYAAKYVSAGTAGKLWQHAENVGRLGMTQEDSLRSLSNPVPTQQMSEVRPVVAKALNAHLKASPVMANGKPRPPEMVALIERLAAEDYAANPGVPVASAIKAAEERAATRFTTVGGRMVPRGELMNGGEQLLDKALGSFRSSLVSRGVIDKAEMGEIGMEPNRHDPRQWVLTRDGRPMKDPDTGKPVVFFPNDLAASYRRWETAKADADTRGAHAYRQIYSGMFRPEADFHEARTELPKKIAENERQLARAKPGTGLYASKTKELEGQRRRYQAVQEAGKAIPAVPRDFFQYLKEN